MARPQLLAEHAAGYAMLVRDQGAESAGLLRRRFVWSAMLVGGLLIGALLSGVAMMLWALAPSNVLAWPWGWSQPAPIVLLAVPLVPLCMAAWAAVALRRGRTLPLWAAVQEQIAADAMLLRGRDV